MEAILYVIELIFTLVGVGVETLLAHQLFGVAILLGIVYAMVWLLGITVISLYNDLKKSRN